MPDNYILYCSCRPSSSCLSLVSCFSAGASLRYLPGHDRRSGGGALSPPTPPPGARPPGGGTLPPSALLFPGCVEPYHEEHSARQHVNTFCALVICNASCQPHALLARTRRLNVACPRSLRPVCSAAMAAWACNSCKLSDDRSADGEGYLAAWALENASRICGHTS